MKWWIVTPVNEQKKPKSGKWNLVSDYLYFYNYQQSFINRMKLINPKFQRILKRLDAENLIPPRPRAEDPDETKNSIYFSYYLLITKKATV